MHPEKRKERKKDKNLHGQLDTTSKGSFANYKPFLGRHKRSNTEKWRNGAIGVIAQFINLIKGAMELENRAMMVIAPFIDSINRAMGLRT